MSVWKTQPVADQPELTLRLWQIIEISHPKLDGTTRHFVGYNDLNSEGRVSSPVQEFDKDRMVGKTRSGRVYALQGDAGLNPDALYVLGLWMEMNGMKTDDYARVDVNDLGGK